MIPGRNPANGSQIYAKGSSISEAEAVDWAKQGDGVAFEALYGRHKRRVYSLCLRMSSNLAEAEDLAQEVFLQVYRRIITFRGQSAFSTWLHRVAVNVVLMRLRRKKLVAVSLEEPLDPEEPNSPTMDLGVRDRVLAGSIDRINLERAIESLPSPYRQIFVLFDIEGYRHSEIAEMIGCTIGNSKSQLHKAHVRLRRILKTVTEQVAGTSPSLNEKTIRISGFLRRTKIDSFERSDIAHVSVDEYGKGCARRPDMRTDMRQER
jgi:RNA polymerase sigma-70 factor (ECF subfamily)